MCDNSSGTLLRLIRRDSETHKEIIVISAIAAMSKNHVIGSDGEIPWDVPADLAQFKKITMFHPVIMGRRTYETFGMKKPLKNRFNIVVSTTLKPPPNHVVVCHTLQHALELTANYDETFIIGGGEMYRRALPYCDRIYLSIINIRCDGDTYFPSLMMEKWKVGYHTNYGPDGDVPAWDFYIYERKGVKTTDEITVY